MRDLRVPFLERGVLAASLAALLFATPGEAARWGFRAAEKTAAPPTAEVAETAGTELPEELDEARKRMIAKQFVGVPELRSLADLGDGYASWLLAERLAGRERWDLTSDIAHYYALAADTGRIGGLWRLIDMIERPEFTGVAPARLAWFEKVLLRYAHQGTPGVIEFLIAAYSSGHPFGEKPDAAIAILESIHVGESARVALELASDKIRREGVTDENADQLKRLLEIADTSDKLSIKITSQNLQAILDRREPLESTAITLETGGLVHAASN